MSGYNPEALLFHLKTLKTAGLSSQAIIVKGNQMTVTSIKYREKINQVLHSNYEQYFYAYPP